MSQSAGANAHSKYYKNMEKELTKRERENGNSSIAKWQQQHQHQQASKRASKQITFHMLFHVATIHLSLSLDFNP